MFGDLRSLMVEVGLFRGRDCENWIGNIVKWVGVFIKAPGNFGKSGNGVEKGAKFDALTSFYKLNVCITHPTLSFIAIQ